MADDMRVRAVEALIPVMQAWGVRSRHSEWTDRAAQEHAVLEATRAILPLIAEAEQNARAAGAAEMRERVEAVLPRLPFSSIVHVRAALSGDADA